MIWICQPCKVGSVHLYDYVVQWNDVMCGNCGYCPNYMLTYLAAHRAMIDLNYIIYGLCYTTLLTFAIIIKNLYMKVPSGKHTHMIEAFVVTLETCLARILVY